MRNSATQLVAVCLAVALCACQAQTSQDRVTASATPPPPPASACITSLHVIPFEPASDTLTPIAQETVAAMHARSRMCQPVRVTFAVAGQAESMQLARQRAAMVEAELVRLGASPQSIRAVACTPTAALDPYTSRTHPNLEGGAMLWVFWHYFPQDRFPPSFCDNAAVDESQ
jgi:outer membrane protein OmpA-like peptidoglycan-associated protein